MNDAQIEIEKRTGMQMEWVRFSIMQQALLNGIFMSACRHLFELQGTYIFYEKTLEYRNRCLQSVNRAISQESIPSMGTIAITMALAIDAVRSPMEYNQGHQC